MQEIIEAENIRPKDPTCPTISKHSAVVCLPVKISPYAKACPPKIHCCGNAIITPNIKCCRGKVNGVCEFTISQKINVELPVVFGAHVDVGDTYVDCLYVKDHEYEVELVEDCEECFE